MWCLIKKKKTKRTHFVLTMGTSVLAQYILRAACRFYFGPSVILRVQTHVALCCVCVCVRRYLDHPQISVCVSVCLQLPERLGEDLSAKLRPHSAGCAAHSCQDHWHRRNPLHLQRALLQVSVLRSSHTPIRAEQLIKTWPSVISKLQELQVSDEMKYVTKCRYK